MTAQNQGAQEILEGTALEGFASGGGLGLIEDRQALAPIDALRLVRKKDGITVEGNA